MVSLTRNVHSKRAHFEVIVAQIQLQEALDELILELEDLNPNNYEHLHLCEL